MSDVHRSPQGIGSRMTDAQRAAEFTPANRSEIETFLALGHASQKPKPAVRVLLAAYDAILRKIERGELVPKLQISEAFAAGFHDGKNLR
jgi:hypothetical protein